jgi:hypothetical protein
MINNDRKQEILRQVNKALEYQFETYSWFDMIKDIPDLSEEEIKWASENTGYSAYICE